MTAFGVFCWKTRKSWKPMFSLSKWIIENRRLICPPWLTDWSGSRWSKISDPLGQDFPNLLYKVEIYGTEVNRELFNRIGTKQYEIWNHYSVCSWPKADICGRQIASTRDHHCIAPKTNEPINKDWSLILSWYHKFFTKLWTFWARPTYLLCDVRMLCGHAINPVQFLRGIKWLSVR